jgi:hypothetical protein
MLEIIQSLAVFAGVVVVALVISEVEAAWDEISREYWEDGE